MHGNDRRLTSAVRDEMLQRRIQADKRHYPVSDISLLPLLFTKYGNRDTISLQVPTTIRRDEREKMSGRDTKKDLDFLVVIRDRCANG